MYAASTQIRVRYAETDQMSYVYHGNYAMYYEIGRVEAMRQLGFSYKELEEEGIIMPVLDLQSRYHIPAKFDELITVKVIVPELPRVRMSFEYEVTNEDGALINEGKTTLVFVNKESQRPCRAPEKLIETLSPHFK